MSHALSNIFWSIIVLLGPSDIIYVQLEGVFQFSVFSRCSVSKFPNGLVLHKFTTVTTYVLEDVIVSIWIYMFGFGWGWVSRGKSCWQIPESCLAFYVSDVNKVLISMHTSSPDSGVLYQDNPNNVDLFIPSLYWCVHILFFIYVNICNIPYLIDLSKQEQWHHDIEIIWKKRRNKIP